MNWAQAKCLLVLTLFAVTGFGPVSLTCLLGLYVLWLRPGWFWRLVNAAYAGKRLPAPTTPARRPHPVLARLGCSLGLLALFIIDIVPLPVTAAIAAAIFIARPAWFHRLVHAVYGSPPDR